MTQPTSAQPDTEHRSTETSRSDVTPTDPMAGRSASGDTSMERSHDNHAAASNGKRKDGKPIVLTPTDPALLRAEIKLTRAELAETVAALAARADVKTRLKNQAASFADNARLRMQDARTKGSSLSDRFGNRGSRSNRPDDRGELSMDGDATGRGLGVLPSALLGTAALLFAAAAGIAIARRVRR